MENGFARHEEDSLDVSTKWQQLTHLIVLCIFMFMGAFGASLIPFYLTMSQKQVKYILAFGAGLLLCTALAVIIPEGVNSLYEYLQQELSEHENHNSVHKSHHHVHGGEKIIGWCLVIGFLTMFLVDNLAICGGLHGHDHSHGRRQECETVELVSPKDNVGHLQQKAESKKKTTMTIGLLIHSLADGIAVGATKASSTTISSLDVIVFTAIMMHKVPAAFGLSILLKGTSNVSVQKFRKELLAFAISAPFGAFCTFLLLHEGFFGIGSLSSLGVACCLLFSGGTFLFVATVHALGELKGPHHVLDNLQIVSFCLGCVVPLLLMPEHHH